MKQFQKLLLLLSATMLTATLTACSSSPAQTTTQPGESTTPSNGSASTSQGGGDKGDTTTDETTLEVVMLSGPTGMGAAKLMTDAQNGQSEQSYHFTTVDANDQVTAMLISGEADIAAISTSVAATLYNKGQEIEVLAVNTLGVLYMLEKGGEEISTMADLRGKTIWTTGQGANPEYILNHLLTQSGLDPETDVTIEYMTAQEVSTKMATEESGIAMLPVPASTALMLKDDGVREALDLSLEWARLAESELPMGAVVARREVIENYPEKVELFLKEYQASIEYMTNLENLAQGGAGNPTEMVTEFGITPSTAVAMEALPKANITYMDGASMKSNLQLYFSVMFQANPDSVGGGLPYDDFYYGG